MSRPRTRPLPFRRVATGAALALGVLAAAAGGWLWTLNTLGETDPRHAAPGPADASPPPAALVARGAGLARAGNCAGCHTAPGGAAYAGGRAIVTPYGAVHASNLTPDAETGLGAWTSAEFRRALRHGRSRNGRLLSPAFPYVNTSHVSADDADAIFAFLRSLPVVRQPNRPHEMRFPYGTQAALAVWRALYFRPATHPGPPGDATRSAEWQRGAYLVRGLGHCSACHGSRNALGATSGTDSFTGARLPDNEGYAPSLHAAEEGSVAGWAVDDIVSLLKTGLAPGASVLGAMASVVHDSTQHLPDADLRAIAVYLKSLPARPPAPGPVDDGRSAAARRSLGPVGESLYGRHCADCHGTQGEGAPGAVAALAGNRAVTLSDPSNLVQVVLHGGFPPSTQGNPRPYGMPPLGHELDDAQVAAVLTFIRASWGNDAPAVSPLDVLQGR